MGLVRVVLERWGSDEVERVNWSGEHGLVVRHGVLGLLGLLGLSEH